MIRRSGDRRQYRPFGIMAVTLGCGDAFHLVPRAVALCTTGLSDYTAALGFGKLVTSVTMTVFYVMLYYIWRERYHIEGRKNLTNTVWILAAVRIALCFFPQNEWFSAAPPVSWGIYRNIPFALLGLLIILAILAGVVIPLTPVQILWMNMATSTTLSFGLAFEPAEKGMMRRAPRAPGQHVLDLHAVWRIAFVGILIACSAFVLEAWMQPRGYSSDLIRTVLLQTLVTAQWVYMFNCRVMDRFPLTREVFVNKGLWVVSAVLLVLQLAIIYLPVMNSLFGTVPMPLKF